jgi:hypothetical protein
MHDFHAMDPTFRNVLDRLASVPAGARKLFCLIVREAFHGPIHPKPPGVATPAEILEACGLDVGEFYSMLEVLANARLIVVSGDYPLEEIRLAEESLAAEEIAERCAIQGIPVENVLVGLDASSFV